MLVDQSSRETDATAKNQIQQIYSGVAELYHQFRPTYPDSIIDEAIQESPLLSQQQQQQQQAHILEIGCGPGTLTLPLALRGFRITAIDPSVGMIQQAQQVVACSSDDNHDHDFSNNVEFQETTFKNFSSTTTTTTTSEVLEHPQQQYDAIVAASSLHWALAEEDQTALIKKLHSLLKPKGTLLLFWNFPPEPSDPKVLDALADALDEPKPFYFGRGSLSDHKQRMHERVLGPIEDQSNLFTPFSTRECPLQEEWPVSSFVSYLKTLSIYIIMEPDEKKVFFRTVEETLTRECGATVKTSRESILDLSRKV
jgi:SAM-dependent methyltransferase